MQAHLYANITSLQLTETLAGAVFQFPKLVAGKHLSFRLRLAHKLEGQSEETHLTVHGIKASIGKVDARPESGTFKLMIGPGPEGTGNVTTDIFFNATADNLATAINALSDLPGVAKPAAVTLEDGSYRIRFKDGQMRDFDCPDNALWPLTFVNVSASEFDEGYIHELRLTQAPAAQTVDFTMVQADLPTMSRVQEGGSNGDVTWNELQKLSIPPEFNVGAFQLRRGFKKTDPIGLPTSGDEITTALKALADEGGDFTVTEQQNAVLIEFGGEAMKGRSQALLEVFVIDGPEPDVSFTLDTDTAAMMTLMRRPDSAGEIKLPLEIELILQDENDPTKLHPVAFRTELTFLRQLNTEDRNISARMNWNQPFSRRSYAPYGPNQFLIGQRHARFIVGDGAATSFVLNHNLNTHDLYISVRENSATGRVLRDHEYTINFDGPNAVTLVSSVVPATASLVALVTTAAHPASFAAHTHTIDDVLTLREQLDALSDAVSELQSIAPSGGLTTDVIETTTAIAEWLLPKFIDIYPCRYSFALPNGRRSARDTQQANQTSFAFSNQQQEPPRVIADITPQMLVDLKIKDGGLLPAIHRADVYEMIDPSAVTEDYEGNVYENISGTDILLPGGKGRKRDVIYPGEFAAYNGHVWYKVKRGEEQGGGNYSFYPAQFDRTLFEIAVNERQLRFKKTFRLDFGFEAGVVSNLMAYLGEFTASPHNTEAQWSVLVEWGEFQDAMVAEDETAPNGRSTGVNLGTINWHSESPIIDHRIILTNVPAVHSFGVEIIRSAAGTLNCNRILYGGKESAPTYFAGTTDERKACPNTANFALRARLSRFDTRDDAWDPRGLVVLIGLNREVGVTDSNTMGRALIK